MVHIHQATGTDIPVFLPTFVVKVLLLPPFLFRGQGGITFLLPCHDTHYYFNFPPFLVIFLVLSFLSCSHFLIYCSLRTSSIPMILGLAIRAQPNIVLYSYILAIICMLSGSIPTGSTLPWFYRWVPHIWTIYIEGV